MEYIPKMEKNEITNKFHLIERLEFDDFAKIVDIYGQGCNYPTKKGVEGYEVQYLIEMKEDGKQYPIIFQSPDRNDNIKAYNGYEMTTSGKFGTDDESYIISTEYEYGDDIIEYLENDAEKCCKMYFECNYEEDD